MKICEFLFDVIKVYCPALIFIYSQSQKYELLYMFDRLPPILKIGRFLIPCAFAYVSSYDLPLESWRYRLASSCRKSGKARAASLSQRQRLKKTQLKTSASIYIGGNNVSLRITLAISSQIIRSKQDLCRQLFQRSWFNDSHPQLSRISCSNRYELMIPAMFPVKPTP